jgi:TetR/AcrR family transcriptional repressor of nem operon
MSKTIKHDIKSDFLLDKGIELLWSKGYNATSVNDIVKLAEIPKGSFYFYFDSKEDFVVQAIEKYFNQQFVPAFEVLQNKEVSPKERLFAFYEFRAATLTEELKCKMGCLGCNLANEVAEHSDAIRTMIAGKGSLIKNHIAAVIQEAQELGEIENAMDSRDLAEFIEDAGKGAMTTMKEMQDSYPIINFTKMVTTILLK